MKPWVPAEKRAAEISGWYTIIRCPAKLRQHGSIPWTLPWGSKVSRPPQHRGQWDGESGRGKFRRVTTQRRKPGGVGGMEEASSGSSQRGNGGKRRQDGGALGVHASSWSIWLAWPHGKALEDAGTRNVGRGVTLDPKRHLRKRTKQIMLCSKQF